MTILCSLNCTKNNHKIFVTYPNKHQHSVRSGNLFLRRSVALLNGAEPLEYCYLMCHVQTEDRKPDQVARLNYLKQHTLEEPRNW